MTPDELRAACRLGICYPDDQLAELLEAPVRQALVSIPGSDAARVLAGVLPSGQAAAWAQSCADRVHTYRSDAAYAAKAAAKAAAYAADAAAYAYAVADDATYIADAADAAKVAAIYSADAVFYSADAKAAAAERAAQIDHALTLLGWDPTQPAGAMLGEE